MIGEERSNIFRATAWGTVFWGNTYLIRVEEDVLDRPYWEREGTVEHPVSGRPAILITTYPNPLEGAQTVYHERDRVNVYKIEVRDSIGGKIGDINDWLEGAQLELNTNQADALSFAVSYDHPMADELKPPNRLWLRDGWNMLIGMFVIHRTRRTYAGDFRKIEIESMSAESQLAQEVVVSYFPKMIEDPDLNSGETGPKVPEEETVQEHLEALLALQHRSPAMVLGDIDEDIAEYETALSVSDTSILGAILSLRNLLPKELAGYIYINSQNELEWKKVLRPGGVELNIDNVVRGFHVDLNWDTLVTRLWLYGAGQDVSSRVNLKSPGADLAQEYLDSATVETYGIVPRLIAKSDIENGKDLFRAAERILEELSDPEIEISLDVLDAAKADRPHEWDWDDLYIGTEYQVVDETYGINTTVSAVQIRVHLDNPLNTQVEFRNRRGTLKDVLDSISQQKNMNVLGDQYPAMGRNLTGHTPNNLRAGDTRWHSSDDLGQMHDGEEWRDLGEGVGGGVGAGLTFGMLHSLDSEGDHIHVRLWDEELGDFEGGTTKILKPYYLRCSTFDGKTLSYTDGESRTYNITDVDKKFQRNRVEYEKNILQWISPPYLDGEILSIAMDLEESTEEVPVFVDVNSCGRTFRSTHRAVWLPYEGV